ncbi:hypothetical protein DCF83_17700 (plasmid) [Edwardsiella tarda]|uniref:hypothetical protein n=1 Tax=Edwardsiella tarda TaxID=636 RepID=UPI0011B2777B|nr:hypothetical protein [Edwardsiella tarda]UCQ29566.1 hypothetical protein DCF83_17700 [Edwardsiella tarda]
MKKDLRTRTERLNELEAAYSISELYLIAPKGRCVKISKGDPLWYRAIARYKIECIRDIEACQSGRLLSK